MRPITEEIKEKCIKLRTEKRLSFREINSITDLPKSTLSKILKNYPLTDQEIHECLSRSAMKLNRSIHKKPYENPSEYYNIVKDKNYSTVQKAKISEAAVLFRLCLHGFSVFGSPFDGDKEDWVVSIDGYPLIARIQVKSIKKQGHGLPCISLGNSHGKKRYKKFEFDFIVGYDLYQDKAYVFSWKETEAHKTMITVTKDSEENWQKIYRGIAQPG